MPSTESPAAYFGDSDGRRWTML
ncbi:uncharacterized protein G2W53_028044 [Senna tora]|uniref:Uncharacterized protein n=1 Tax=Senna tora TaxID=362788 RepID=A0A834T1W6_9FABA|nr:uncharacterized protein G2W53_028044 [Senna tora]